MKSAFIGIFSVFLVIAFGYDAVAQNYGGTRSNQGSGWQSDGFGNTGTNGSAFVSTNTSSKNDWLISPSIDLGTGNSYVLNFDIAMTYSNDTTAALFHEDDSVAVVISTNNGLTWSQTNILQEWLSGSEASSLGENAVHGSDSDENAKKEIAFFFSDAELITNN